METYVVATLGGVLIGAAALLLLFLNGTVFGVSGILAGALRPGTTGFSWRFAAIFGLLSGGFFLRLTGYEFFSYSLERSLPVIAAAGFLVGYGARLGGGCTSGHGVCGMSRLAPRSILATCVFVTAGVVTVYIIRLLPGVLP